LTHHNIVRIHDFAQDSQSACISMEYVDGTTLSGMRIDRPGKVFEPDELLPLIEQTCEALTYAHSRARIVHRDLKPANLMLNVKGELKITDFGIARSLSESVSLITMGGRGSSGTLPYMSPQQLDGERVSHLDDIYSLGATIYDLLTSKPPFYRGDVARQVHDKTAPSMRERREELGIASDVPIAAQWERAVAACLAKDPSARPQSANEVLALLRAAPPSRPPNPAESSHQPLTRVLDQPGFAGIKKAYLAVAGLAIAAALGTWFFLSQPKSPEEKRLPAANGVIPMQTQTTSISPRNRNTSNGFGGLLVDTSPSGATILLGGMETGTSPVTFKGVPVGKYPLRIALDGYETVEQIVEIKLDQFVNLGAIPLQPGKGTVELTSTPPGAKVFRGTDMIGTTPFEGAFGGGDAVFLVSADGYLPCEVKKTIKAKETAKENVTLAKPASSYKGAIQVKGESSAPAVALTITLNPDLRSGTMTQTGRRGDTVVKFTGVWEGTALRAVTGDIVSKPETVRWDPESFSLRFSNDGSKGSYECVAGGKTYIAELKP
jgi:serine/threonine protein kinase